MRGITFSDCGKYQYRYHRVLEINGAPIAERAVLFMMVNPSTDDTDPGVQRCTEFARSWGFNHMWVGNLFAYRANDMRVLREAYHMKIDIIGPENDYHIRQMAKVANMIVCCWGPNAELRGFTERTRQVCDVLRYFGDLYLINRTRDGGPAHPLYLHSRLRPSIYMERK